MSNALRKAPVLNPCSRIQDQPAGRMIWSDQIVGAMAHLGFYLSYLRSWSHWYGTRFRITRTLGSRATCNGAIRPSDLRTLGQPSGFRTFRSSDLRTSDLRISIPRSWDPPTPTHTADHTTFSNATHPHTQHPAEGPKVRGGKGCTAISANQ